MTYIELFSEIDKRIELTHELGGCHPEQHALRAVVELHYEHIGGAENAIYCYECSVHYPCPTIQAIEKELG